MVATQELENLQTWLDQHASGYFLSFSKGGVTTAEAVKQLAESCDEIDIEGRRVWMEWTNRQANPSGLRSQSIIAIVDQARCIQLEPKPLTFEAYMERCPEKLELSGGYLGSDIEDAFSAVFSQLRQGILTNFGTLISPNFGRVIPSTSAGVNSSNQSCVRSPHPSTSMTQIETSDSDEIASSTLQVRLNFTGQFAHGFALEDESERIVHNPVKHRVS